jgi:hypothetical protein
MMRYQTNLRSPFIRRFVAGLMLASYWTIVLPGGVRIASSKSFMLGGAGLLLQIALLVAVATAFAMTRNKFQFGGTQRDAELIRAREWSRMTGSGWVARYARYGALMGLAIGVPIGAALAFGMKPEELPGNSRVLMELIFLTITMGWTVPACFGMRWLIVRQMRPGR